MEFLAVRAIYDLCPRPRSQTTTRFRPSPVAGRARTASAACSWTTGTACTGWSRCGSTAASTDGSTLRTSCRRPTSRSPAPCPITLNNPEIPVFLWLRHITGVRLKAVHRRHLGTKVRDAGREVRLGSFNMPQASSMSLAAQLLGRLTSPSQAASRAELQLRVQDALDELAPLDREVLALRHFEQLSNAEVVAGPRDRRDGGQ